MLKMIPGSASSGEGIAVGLEVMLETYPLVKNIFSDFEVNNEVTC